LAPLPSSVNAEVLGAERSEGRCRSARSAPGVEVVGVGLGPAIVDRGDAVLLGCRQRLLGGRGATAIVTIASTPAVTKDWMPEAIFSGRPARRRR
jgi:hypothetical protein